MFCQGYFIKFCSSPNRAAPKHERDQNLDSFSASYVTYVDDDISGEALSDNLTGCGSHDADDSSIGDIGDRSGKSEARVRSPLTNRKIGNLAPTGNSKQKPGLLRGKQQRQGEQQQYRNQSISEQSYFSDDKENRGRDSFQVNF